MAITGIGAAAGMPGALNTASDAAAQADNGAFDALLKRLENADGAVPASEKTAGTKPVIDKTDKLYEQCEALETFLIKNLLNSMRATVQKSGFMEEGFADKMYEDMLYDKYAEELSKDTNFGFAELAYMELTGQRGLVINEKF
jgi:flagellar protein FlgJ